MATKTTGVEVMTPVGGRACIDAEGWHSGEPMLLAQLQERCPLVSAGEDPILDAAQRAAKDMDLKILVIRRHAIASPVVPPQRTRLLRALTDSMLHRSLFGTPDDAIEGARPSRVLMLAVVCVLVGIGAIIYGWLAHHT